VGRSGCVAHLCGLFVPAEPVECEWATDHVAAEPERALPVFAPHGSVGREAAVAPGEEIACRLLSDETLVHEHAQNLGAEQAFEVTGIEAWQVVEAPIGAEAAIGREDVEVGMGVEQLTRGLQKTHGAGSDLVVGEGHLEVELESPPGTGGELTQEVAVRAEKEAEAL